MQMDVRYLILSETLGSYGCTFDQDTAFVFASMLLCSLSIKNFRYSLSIGKALPLTAHHSRLVISVYGSGIARSQDIGYRIRGSDPSCKVRMQDLRGRPEVVPK